MCGQAYSKIKTKNFLCPIKVVVRQRQNQNKPNGHTPSSQILKKYFVFYFQPTAASHTGYSSTVRLLDLEDRRSKLYLAMNTKLELNENGHPICPEVPKKPHAHPYLKVLRYLERPENRELSELYNLNYFAFGLYNRLPHPSDCG